jgi:integrase
MKLTKQSIAAVKKNAGKKSDYIEWDDELKGFGLRLRDGKYTWVFQYKFNGANFRMRLGTLPPLSADDARKLAHDHKSDVYKAQDGDRMHPGAKREQQRQQAAKGKPKHNTLASTIPAYLDAKRGAIKGSTRELQQRHLNEHFSALHDRPINNITRADVATVLTTITNDRGPSAANRARATLSTFYVWAIGEGICDHNPVVGTNKRAENDPRERSLSDAEAAAIWLAAPNTDFGRILKLLLLTGCRREEIGGLKWSEIDLEARTITLPRERTKNGQEHVVPLSDAALAIITGGNKNGARNFIFGKRDGGYQSWSKSKTEIDEVVKFKNEWTLHDLRRTVRTGLGKLGVQPHIAEAVLNHLPPRLIRTYDRNTYMAEKKAALDLWASHLKVAVAQTTGANITSLRKR